MPLRFRLFLTGLALACAGIFIAFLKSDRTRSPSVAPARPAQPAPGPNSLPPPAPATQTGKAWALVWADEFDVPGAPDPTRWAIFTGFTKTNSPVYYTGRPENVRVENGCLVFEARHETFRNPNFRLNSPRPRQRIESFPYTSGRVQTLGKAAWKYGRIVTRVRLPHALGTHSAIWTMGENYPQLNWPRCGEIDILEYLGRMPDVAWQVVHYSDESGKDASVENRASAPALADGRFHEIALEWDQDEIRWFVDGTRTWTFATEDASTSRGNPYRLPHFLILNLSIGGWGQDPDPRQYPARMEVDYVRVYSR